MRAGEPPSPPAAEVVVIAAGVFAAGLGWPGLIGRLPFTLLLKNELQLPAHLTALFWAVAASAWYVKPLVGLVCDAVPLFGTRRRGYLLAGTGAAAALWLAVAVVPRSYGWLLAVTMALDLAIVLVTTAIGALLVEAGQRYGATGRLSSLRQGVIGVMSLIAGPIGGWLASRPFGWTALSGALILLSFVPVVALLHPEPRGARADAAVLAAARAQLRTIARSRPLWATAGLMFLVHLAPGFGTPLLYYQQDVLGFSAAFMGTLQLLGGAGVLLGSAAYAALCRVIPLRVSLAGGIVLNAASTLLYLGYDSAHAALLINTAAAIVGTLATLPLYDLAMRVTPKGSESLGFALILSVYSLAQFGLSDVLGSTLYDRFHLGLKDLVWVNAGSTAAVLLFLPLLPRGLLSAREGTNRAAPSGGR